MTNLRLERLELSLLLLPVLLDLFLSLGLGVLHSLGAVYSGSEIQRSMDWRRAQYQRGGTYTLSL